MTNTNIIFRRCTKVVIIALFLFQFGIAAKRVEEVSSVRSAIPATMMNEPITNRMAEEVDPNQASQLHSNNIVNELVQCEEIYEENGDLGEKQYMDYWNDNTLKVSDTIATTNSKPIDSADYRDSRKMEHDSSR